jgi:curved DNA-binding protein CbpA
MLRLAEQADYFELLGLPPDCRRQDVLQVVERLLEELAIDRCPPSDAMLLDKVEEVRRVLAESRDVLGDDRLRGAYRSALGR